MTKGIGSHSCYTAGKMSVQTLAQTPPAKGRGGWVGFDVKELEHRSDQSTSCPAPGTVLPIPPLSVLLRSAAAHHWEFIPQSTWSCFLAIHSLQSVKHNKERRKERSKSHSYTQPCAGRNQQEKETCTSQLDRFQIIHLTFSVPELCT